MRVCEADVVFREDFFRVRVAMMETAYHDGILLHETRRKQLRCRYRSLYLDHETIALYRAGVRQMVTQRLQVDGRTMGTTQRVGMTDSHVRTVYICHPYRGDPVGNRLRVAAHCRRLAHDGVLPLAPQLMLPAFLDERAERELAMGLCLRMVRLADEVLVCGAPTEGMQREIAEATRRGIRVRHEKERGALVGMGG